MAPYFVGGNCYAQDMKYCVAKLPTPVLNTPRFSSVFGGEDGKTVKVDKSGLIRAMEFIALPGTAFHVIDVYRYKGRDILEVTTKEYPSRNKLYIDSRFVTLSAAPPRERTKKLPSMRDITGSMSAMEGSPYMWGGNYCGGIKEMLGFYKPSGPISKNTERLWTLRGVDCSGLLYEATDGYIPRNTSSLVNYGKGLNISGRTAGDISKILKPLDIIVWSGHVIVVLNDREVIESTGSGGVKRSGILEKLKKIISEKKPVNDWNSTSGDRFVVRRWFT